MNSDVYLASALSSLKFIASSPLARRSSNPSSLSKYIKEFKVKLIESLESNGVSDNFLKNVAECLYDLKACDRKISYHLSRSFETRAGIVSSQLKGGVLWVHFNDPSLTRARRKVINASCRVAIKQATREFLDLKENVTNISRFESLLRNLKIVGDCYKLPISFKVRLEQSILESSEILKLSFECYPLLNKMCDAFRALLIDNEKIGALMTEIFLESLEKEDIITLAEICSTIRILYKWEVVKVDKRVRCIEILRDLVKLAKYNCKRNVPNTIKLFTACVRLPKIEASCELCELILSNSVGCIEGFCSNGDLVLFFNSLAHFKRAYPDSEVLNMDSIISNLETFLIFGKTDVKKEDVNTIHRSCTILKDKVNVNSLLEMSTKLLDQCTI